MMRKLTLDTITTATRLRVGPAPRIRADVPAMPFVPVITVTGETS